MLFRSVQTILLRVYRSLQLCAPICVLTSPSSGSLWQSGPDGLRLGLTLAFGTTVGIITNQDLARRLAIHYRVPLAGDGTDHPPKPEPFVSRRFVIASAYIAALLWAFHVGSNTAVGILGVVHGRFGMGQLVEMVVEVAIGGLQVILLGSIGMLCAEERREVAEQGVSRLQVGKGSMSD